MSYEEKGTWVYLVTSAGAYAVYLLIIVGRLASTPAAQVPYIVVLLWTAGARWSRTWRAASWSRRPAPATAAGPTCGTGTSAGSASTPAAGSWWPGAAAAWVMAMAKAEYFWIANVIYLGFVLWAVVGSVLKLVAYRRGL